MYPYTNRKAFHTMEIVNVDKHFWKFSPEQKNQIKFNVIIQYIKNLSPLKIPVTSKPKLTNGKPGWTSVFYYLMIQGPFKWRAPLGHLHVCL